MRTTEQITKTIDMTPRWKKQQGISDPRFVTSKQVTRTTVSGTIEAAEPGPIAKFDGISATWRLTVDGEVCDVICGGGAVLDLHTTTFAQVLGRTVTLVSEGDEYTITEISA